MNWELVTANPLVSLAVAAVVGIILGWFFTGVGARRREDALKGEISKLEAQARSLRRENEDAGAKAKKLQSSLAAREEDMAAAAKQVAALRAEQQSLAEAKAAGEAELLSRDEEVERLRAIGLELEDSRDQAVAERDAATSELEALRKQMREAEAKLAEAQATAATGDEVSALQAELHAAQRSAEQKMAALDAAFTRASELQRQLQVSDKRLLAAEKEIETLRLDLEHMSALKQESDARVQRARGEVASEMALLTNTMLKMRDESLGKANARVAELVEELAALRAARAEEALPLPAQAGGDDAPPALIEEDAAFPAQAGEGEILFVQTDGDAPLTLADEESAAPVQAGEDEVLFVQADEDAAFFVQADEQDGLPA